VVKNKPERPLNQGVAGITLIRNNPGFSPPDSETGEQQVDHTLGTGPPNPLILD